MCSAADTTLPYGALATTMPRREQRNALPDKHRHDADDELVDRIRIQEGRNQPAATHQPDVLSSTVAQPADEIRDGLGDELNA